MNARMFLMHASTYDESADGADAVVVRMSADEAKEILALMDEHAVLRERWPSLATMEMWTDATSWISRLPDSLEEKYGHVTTEDAVDEVVGEDDTELEVALHAVEVSASCDRVCVWADRVVFTAYMRHAEPVIVMESCRMERAVLEAIAAGRPLDEEPSQADAQT